MSRLRKIVTIGEILVEIMATRRGQSFLEAGDYRGPFPSGAPAIFVNQAALLGQPAAIVSAVGEDAFGAVNLNRLRASGVDVSAVAVRQGPATGSAFVTYAADGSRDFLFNIAHSACGTIPFDASARAAVAGADHLHVMGSALAAPGLAPTVLQALDAVKGQGGTVSFDPNLRKEMARAPGLRPALERVLEACDLFLPSGEELFSFCEATTEDAAAAELLARGIEAVVVKKGAAGAVWYDGAGRYEAAPLAVEEVDPTGAGDSFGAAAVSFWLRGLAAPQALARANAAGAAAVTALGPMEGALDSAALDAMLRASD
ncbi:sugar kinase [Pseudoroseicyclus aestuarii]|uniref:Sugar/nucleoside kinase (Ribokinase family) n=1 Tax=Pseudoroseicyclus aestuarii TaxID=1795041 RepID=A0A318SM84_9RHOB|nr:sugar kinase [Pseudoroseicyclus aestuarii]PYE81171.1 sugar/nucleoside kinase (ribokinase family) [Pseudoroseicyclus aestuarii]